MQLVSEDGVEVGLRPLRYEFGASREPRDWDANWLVVAGDVVSDRGSWSFVDACLTTWEARELGSWLRGVHRGEVAPTSFPGEETEPSLVFTEPSLAFSLAGRDGGTVTLRVHLSLRSLPPWLQHDGADELFAFFVEVRLTTAALVAAEAAWEQELAGFPIR